MDTSATEFIDDDDRFFAVVAKELSVGRKEVALWTKAFAFSDGDENKTKALYIRLRVEQLCKLAKQSKSTTLREDPKTEASPKQSTESVGAATSKPTDATLIEDRTAQYRAMVGPNDDYYVAKFKNFEKPGNEISWNWSAFFLNVQWALYRKLWGVAASGVFVGAGVHGILGAYMPAASGVFPLVFMATFGVFGNYLYYRKIKSILDDRSRTKQPFGGVNSLQKRGGTTFVPFYLICSSIVVFFLYQWIEHTQDGRSTNYSIDENRAEVPKTSLSDAQFFGDYQKPSATDSLKSEEESKRFWGVIDRAVPNFEQIDKDPSWIKFLDTKVGGRDYTYRDAANDAISDNNPFEFLIIVRTWQSTSANGLPK